ncbi:MAG: hypothetical protein ACPG6B_04695 [Oceanihabitans sp.]
MFKKTLLWTIIVLLAIFLYYLLFIVKIGPLNTSKEASTEITGIVDSLYEGGIKDLVIKLENDNKIYYINRALENGFNLEDINNILLEKEVTIWLAKSRSDRSFHIMQLQQQDSIYYTEWQIPLARKN